jgi:hypothetical protein
MPLALHEDISTSISGIALEVRDLEGKSCRLCESALSGVAHGAGLHAIIPAATAAAAPGAQLHRGRGDQA